MMAMAMMATLEMMGDDGGRDWRDGHWRRYMATTMEMGMEMGMGMGMGMTTGAAGQQIGYHYHWADYKQLCPQLDRSPKHRANFAN